MPRLAFSFGFLTFCLAGGTALAQDRVLLREAAPVGTSYAVSTRGQISGRIEVPVGEGKPAKSVDVRGICTTAYREEILAADPRVAERRTLRVYDSIDFRKTVADVDRRMSLRPEIRVMVFLEKQGKCVPFSPRGPLTWEEIEFLRTETFLPALAGLLPGREVQPLETWKIPREAARDLTDLDTVDECDFVGRFVQATTLNGRRVAEISLAGSARGLNEDGPTKHALKGTAYFDIEAKTIAYLSILGEQRLYDSAGKVTGTLEGRFVVTREPREADSLRKSTRLAAGDLEPGDANTKLLFESAELGVNFEYPRRWHIGQTRGRQITVDEVGGSGILITVESGAALPSAEKYEREVADYLRDRKVPLRSLGGIRRLNGAAPIQHFAFEAEEATARPILDYYIVAGKSRGATVAARIVGNDIGTLRKEGEAIARSLRFRE